MKVKPRGIEIPLIILLIALSIFVLSAIGIVIYRLGQSGVFEQENIAQTEIADATTTEVTTTTLLKETTAAKTTKTEAEKTSATKKETETTTEKATTTETTTTEETTTVKKTEKTEKTESTKKTDNKKTDTKKTDNKADATTNTTTTEQKDPLVLYQEYIRNVLVPQYGLPSINEEKRADEGRGLISAVIRDFNHSGELEMLVVRVEPYNSNYAPYPIFELYGIRDQRVTFLSDTSCSYPMSEWSLRYEGDCVYLSGVQADVGALEENIRINQIDIDVTRHSLLAVRDSYTIGVPEGPEKSYSDEALWVCEITNHLVETNRGNEGRVYVTYDYTEMRNWAK